MATPIYNASWAGGWHYRPGRRWGVVDRSGSWFGGGTPRYNGSGQPMPDNADSSASGTPDYLSAPQTDATQAAATAPQPQVAIVVPRT